MPVENLCLWSSLNVSAMYNCSAIGCTLLAISSSVYCCLLGCCVLLWCYHSRLLRCGTSTLDFPWEASMNLSQPCMLFAACYCVDWSNMCQIIIIAIYIVIVKLLLENLWQVDESTGQGKINAALCIQTCPNHKETNTRKSNMSQMLHREHNDL